ncbi:MAG: carbohydrate kinase family protein [Promethearchaeota archaeon]
MYDIVTIGNPLFIHKDDRYLLSGPSVYSATTATKLGIEQQALVSAVGSDMTNDFIQSLGTLGIPEYYIVEDKKPRTVHHGVDNTAPIDLLMFPQKLGIRDIPEEFLRAQAILLSPSLQEIDSELIEWICNSSDALLVLDPQLHTIDAKGRLSVIEDLNLTEKTQCFLDIIQTNEKEALLITGESDPYVSAELLVEWAAEMCIVTMGEKGSLIYDGNDFLIIPPYSTNTNDEIGAGSIYLTGFVSQYISGKTLSECGAFGSSLASIKVENDRLDFQVKQNDILQRYEIISESIKIR